MIFKHCEDNFLLQVFSLEKICPFSILTHFSELKGICEDEPRCLKIAEKVSFYIVSEASYVYILSGQKFIKNAENGQFGEFLKS